MSSSSSTEVTEVATKPSLSEARTDILSLYSPEEELGQLQRVAEKLGFPIQIFEIRDAEHGLGYAVFPKDTKQQANIIAGAPWIVMDFDDTIGRSSMTKARAREKLISQLGLDEEIVKFCDKIARCRFADEHGSQYYAELEMRLLTFAHEKELDNSQESRQRIEGYLQFLLTQHHSMMGILNYVAVHPTIHQIFQEERFSVEQYPAAETILSTLRGSDGIVSNMFVLTYGDPAFQLEKTIHLLKKGSVQGIFLTKAKKGPFLEALIERNPFQDVGITYTEHSESHDGIQPARDQSAIIVIDDDPHQVASLEETRKKLELFSLAILRASHAEHKRFAVQTPGGEQVGEISLESSSPDEQVLDARILKQKAIRLALEKSFLDGFRLYLEEMNDMPLFPQINRVIRRAFLAYNPSQAIRDFLRYVASLHNDDYLRVVEKAIREYSAHIILLEHDLSIEEFSGEDWGNNQYYKEYMLSLRAKMIDIHSKWVISNITSH